MLGRPGGRPTGPLWRTASFGYLRMHAGRASPPPSYGRRAIDSWLRRIADQYADSDDVYVYFNNDHGAAAVRNAIALTDRATALRLSVARSAGAATVAG